MDLSTALSAMSAAGASMSGGTGSSGAVACPVCTLYLREGISLQKHLDTHPKEQVIEALIRASSSGAAAGLLGATQPQTPTQPPPPTTPTPTPAPSSSVQPAPSPSPHVPHPAQSPYPIGPIFECPPINAMMPPQFASFSYQQFVNNGTMMVPAQYAMAQAQAPQTNQMMQMLYNPYGMYHQQQIPTVQMISAPPMMPTSTATLPTSMPAAVTTRIRPAAPSICSLSASANETTTPTSPQPVPSSPPRPVMTSCTQQQQHEQQEQPQSDQVAVESPKMQMVQEIASGPDRILPDLEEASASPEPTQTATNDEEDSCARLESSDEQAQNERTHEDERHLEQYQSADPPTSLSNGCEESTDGDKTERILPEIEDNQEIESLLIRDTNRVETHKDADGPLAELESVEPMEVSVQEEITTEDVEENNSKQISEISSYREIEDDEDRVKESEQIVEECQSSPQDLSFSETRTSNKSEIEQVSRLLINIESEFSNVGLSSKIDDENSKDHNDDIQDMLSVEPQDKNIEEDESTSISYRKTPEPIECKIIVSHDDTDVSSVASSSESIQCDREVRKITTSSYDHKICSQSVSAIPTVKKKCCRSLSRASLRSDISLSNANIWSYPVGFDATTLQDCLKDNYNDEDMELEEPHHSFLKQSDGIILERERSQTPMSTSMSGVSILKARRSKVPSSPVSMQSTSSYCQQEEDEEDSDVESCVSVHDEKDDYDEEDEEEDGMMEHQIIENEEGKCKKEIANKHECRTILASELSQQQTEAVDFRSQTLMAEHYSVAQFPLEHHIQQQQSTVTAHNETYPLSNSGTSQNLLNMSECADPTSSTDSKSYSSSNKSTMQKPSAELLNINEDAHAGPINVFEFDGLQILVPSTFISESSQKAVSGTSQQSMSSSENGAGNDEEVKSVNMRADETMPARGELSEQESNGCTEQSAWQLYMGQESSRMSTSYDLMARESWEDSEGSDHDDNNGGPLLDSRSLATQFTSSLFLDRDRKTPTRRIYKCSHCPELFECPKERRVHSTMVHKEAGPSGCSNDNMDQPEPKDIKLLEGRVNVFDDLFVPSTLHAQQQLYQHLQQPLLHQLQPPQHVGAIDMKGDAKLEALHLSAVTEVICSLCNQRFTSEKSLQIHHRRMHMAEPTKRVRENAKCQICNEEFTSVASFNFHLKVHPLECGQCGKYFYRKQNFKLHMKRHLGIKPFPCTLCDKAFLTKQKLDEHTNGHTGNAPVKCNLCNETFRRYSNLTQHKNRHHLNIKKKLKDYICHCGEVFHTKKKLAWHKETHDEKPKACTYCNERFIHMASLTRHMRRAHNKRFVPDAQRENENVECPICKSIYLRSSLAVHMRVHNGEKPYECQICSKTFSTKWNLQLHKWTHAPRSTKPYKCSQCSAAFYRHSDYTAHVNSHRNVRPYTCNYCGAQFIRKYNCLRHVKEHEENKSYTCDVCNKTFHRSYYLKEHKRVHTGQRPYTCHICGKSSSTKSNHNKHVRIHHAREPVNTEN